MFADDTSSELLYIPDAGAFAVARIDPDASLAYLNDPVAIEAARKETFRDYVVYITGDSDLPFPGVSYRQETISLVLPSMPVDVPEEGITGAMSLPIQPTATHPTGRAPLATDGVFPWANCYLSPFAEMTVRCPNVLAADPVVCALDIPEQVRMHVLFQKDIAEYHRAQKRKQSSAPDERPCSDAENQSIADSNSASGDSVSMCGDEQSSHATFSLEPVPPPTEAQVEEATAEQREAAEIAALARFLLMPRAAPEEMITVTFTHNLSRVKDVNHPSGFYAEMDVISRIVKESVARRIKAAQDDAKQLDERTAIYLAHHARPAKGPKASKVSAIRRWSAKLREIFC
ncbi:hypothetical protein MKEN_00623600 [Mycena kentingensis (nom. inval.)]|nr:hypothetical protein MKEN_00623600 [Mycena kentingensis (nom. inval.)]